MSASMAKRKEGGIGEFIRLLIHAGRLVLLESDLSTLRVVAGVDD